MTELTVLEVRSDALAKKTQWIRERDQAIELARLVEVVENREQLDIAGMLQNQITKLVKQLSNERTSITRPLDDMKKEIMAQERDMVVGLERELKRLRDLNGAYATRLAAEAEAERQRKQAEFERQAMEQAMAAELFGADAIEQPALGAAPIIQQPQKPKADGVRLVERWMFEVVTPNQVPREYCAPVDALIRNYMKYSVDMGREPIVLGVRFWKTVDAQSK